MAALADEPDLWDVNLSDWSNDSQTSRFSQEGFQEPYIGFVKSLTDKPVVGVGRYTSPDTMARIVGNGILDLHRRGAALDFRPIPSEQDPRRAHRRHPGVHRLQYLRCRRPNAGADTLHAKPDYGRGMAARLASGGHTRR